MRATFLTIALVLCLVCATAFAQTKKVRPAAVAGSFYPNDPAKLAATVDDALSHAGTPDNLSAPVALIAPHAGYEYSGAIAARSFALLRGRKVKRVIIVAPSHIDEFGFTSVYDGVAYSTPLGTVPVDQDFARKLIRQHPSIRLSSMGHGTDGQRAEHAIEDELPFLQRTLGNFSLVPIVMGTLNYADSRALGVALAALLRNSNDTLLVASSDLSHYHTYEQARQMDQGLLSAVSNGDFLSVSHNVLGKHWEACGAAPIMAIMIAAERLGAPKPRVLAYANSGDVTSDKSRVIGYSAVAFFREKQERAEDSFDLTDAERAELLKIARTSVERSVREHKAYEPPRPQSAALTVERGAFVTITRRGKLRGCIGYTSATEPLYLTVRDVAALAAQNDDRFPPVQENELGELEYEVSVISPFRHVLDPTRVKIGTHGLLVKRGNQEGILLPQVAVEQHWTHEQYLEAGAEKAGLPRDALQDPNTDLFTFTAIYFKEERNRPQTRSRR